MEPLAEYTTRRNSFGADAEILKARLVKLGNWRLALALLTAVLAWFVFVYRYLPLWLLALPLAAFIWLAFRHQTLNRSLGVMLRAAAYYGRAIARLNGQWAGTGRSGERFRDSSHVYADDLDLFGKGSLFELLSTVRTAAGEETLARWLLAPAKRDEILARQAAAEELRTRIDLRQDIALLAEDVRSDVRVETLTAFGEAPPVHFPFWLRPLGILLAICGIVAVLAFFGQMLPLWPLALILGLDFFIIYTLRGRVAAVLELVEGSARDMRVFAGLVKRLEAEQFSSPRLAALREALDVSGRPASARIARLGRLIDWLDSSDHVIVRVLRPLVFWQEQLAISFENWRRESGSHIGRWLQTTAEFEALSSLGGLAYERPQWTTANILPEDNAQLHARGLKHPLIGETVCVGNDISLSSDCPMLVVSGSNMSGKSTLLRTLGLNAVLALAGARVPAQSLSLSHLLVGASIRVNDSLQDHRSRFMAEITRIREIVDLTKSGTAVLFLLDELLSGTNSHDRRIGAAGIARELLQANAIGLITTHDLALAQIEDDVSRRVGNVHFEDQMNGGEMTFDYKLKQGVVTRSNAIELMRAVGLEV